MKKLLALLMLLLFLLLAFFGWKWYKKTVVCCAPIEEKVEQIVEEVVKTGPLVYNWENSEAITNDLWDAKKQDILSKMKEGQILQIVGPYFGEEVNNSNFENMGIARAESVKKLFEGKIDSNLIETSGKLVDYSDAFKTNPFEYTDFNWAVNNENIKQLAEKTLIYFPTNSTKQLDNENINSFLKDLAELVNKTDQSITLVGHSDSQGDKASNKALALKRANKIRSILVANGVASDRISTSSDGELNPISSNDTKEGRQENRRVELKIIQK